MAATFRAAKSAAKAQAGAAMEIEVEKPTSTAAGDVLIAHIAFNRIGGSGKPACTPPEGWESIRKTQGQGSEARQAELFRRLAGGAEPASYIFTVAGTSATSMEAAGGIAAFQGCDPKAPVNADGGSSIGPATAEMLAPSLVTTVPDCLVVAFASSNAAVRTFTAPVGMDERWDQSGSSLVSGTAATDKAPLAAGETGTRLIAANGTTAGTAQAIALAPGLESKGSSMPLSHRNRIVNT